MKTPDKKIDNPSDGQEPVSLQELAAGYQDAVIRGDRHGATELIQSAVRWGVSVRKIYLEVFQPVQHKLGELWQHNEISVAQEHFATAVTQLNMSQLYSHIFTTEKNGRSLVATCVGGELHEIGVRMVADFFEMDGWDTHYLGANTPVDGILETLHRIDPDVLAVSTSMTFNVPEVISLIQETRERASNPDLLILVGGRPFNTDPDLWRKAGADLYAPDAQEAIRCVNRAVGGRPQR